MIDKKFWKNRNVLVTGHTGFKGSWLCLWLKKLGANVSGISLLEPVSTPNLYSTIEIGISVNDFRGDIVNYNDCLNTVKTVKPNIIFHLAAQPLVRESYYNPLNTYKTNIIGTANILEAAHVYGNVKSIVIITSDKCYENIEKEYAYVETDSLGGFDPYSSSKACAEHVASAYYRSFFRDKNIGLATVRSGNVIGGGDWSIDRLIPDMMKSWSKNEKLKIRYPLATRPWQHVLEPLYGYLSIAKHLWNKPIEYSSGWNFGPPINCIKTVEETVKKAMMYWDDSAKYDISSKTTLHEANLLQLNSAKANTFLGWKSQMDFDNTINNTISWYREYYSKNRNMIDYTLEQITNYENELINE